MAITQDYILKGGLKGSDEAANNKLQAMDQAAAQKAQQDAQLRQLITGKSLETQENERQRQADLADVQKLRGIVGKDANISAGHVKIDPRVVAPGENLTPGQKAADTAFGKEYSDYVASGGSAGLDKNLTALQRAKEDLPNTTGFERVMGGAPDMLRQFLTPKAVAREDAVKGAIQATLRQTLGAQFTEKEGKALMDRAYNPRLSPQENMVRVQAIIDELKGQAAQRKRSAEQFEKTGSLVGLGAAPGLNQPQQPMSIQQANPQNKVPTFEEWKRMKAGK